MVSLANAQVTQTINIPFSTSSAPLIIAAYEAKYDLPRYDLTNVAWCESQFIEGAYNPKDSDGLPAIGLMQFKDKTFYNYAAQMGLSNPNIHNPFDQLDVAGFMFSTGEKKQWGGCRNSTAWERAQGP